MPPKAAKPVITPARMRNFSIIAHIDHGKSTLADRLLQPPRRLRPRGKEQLLDDMDLERERGITIKASAVTVRTCTTASVHAQLHRHARARRLRLRGLPRPQGLRGRLLVVDAAQGVEAQTVVNAYLAVEQDLELIPVLNKIDLPAARPTRSPMEVEQVLGLPAEDCIPVSAKTGQGIDELLTRICDRLPPPREPVTDKTRALIFDAVYDDYRGVVLYCRVFDGTLKRRRQDPHDGMERTFTVTELGKYTPKPTKVKTSARRDLLPHRRHQEPRRRPRRRHHHHRPRPRRRAPPGYEEPQQMVFCDFYPATTTDKKGADFEDMREAIEKLSLNDASFTFQAVHSEALGFGFRCGFLGPAPHGHHPGAPRARGRPRDRPDRPHRHLQGPHPRQGRRARGDRGPQPRRPARHGHRRSRSASRSAASRSCSPRSTSATS
jgi:GTP-binding protein LepA